MDFSNNLSEILQCILKGEQKIKVGDKRPFERCHSVEVERTTSDSYRENDASNLREVLTSVDLMLKIFENNYEKRFDAYIKCIFREVENVLEYVAARSDSSRFPLSQLYDIVAKIVDITLSHSSDENASMLANLHKRNICQMMGKVAGTCEGSTTDEFAMRLRTISILYEKIGDAKTRESKSGQTTRTNLDKLCKCMVSDDCASECKVFLGIITRNSELVAVQTLLNVIPKFVSFSGNEAILHYIWDDISRSVQNGNPSVEPPKIFVIMCYLSDFYFSKNNPQLVQKVLRDKNFWVLVQNGFASQDVGVRKQALYLLKMSLQYLQGSHFEFDCARSDDAGGKSQAKDSDSSLMYWDPNLKQDLCEEFNEFCTIVEYLEEKQAHLIEPIFGVIERFIDKNARPTGKLNSTWVVIVLQRMLNHDNVKIIKFAISRFLKIDICRREDALATMIRLLVASMNWTRLYVNSCAEMLEQFSEYFVRCSRSGDASRFFKILAREIGNVQWSSEALLVVVTAVSSVTEGSYWGTSEIESLKKLVARGTANHYTYIRSGMLCQLLVLSLNVLDASEVSLTDLARYLSCFDRRLSLRRGTEMWELVARRIRVLYSAEDAEGFVEKHVRSESDLDPESIGKMTVMLCDSFGSRESFALATERALELVFASFAGVHARPYCDKRIYDRYLSIVYHVVLEGSEEADLLKNLKSFLPNIVSYIEVQLSSARHVRDFESCQNYAKMLSVILRACAFPPQCLSVAANWGFKIVETLVAEGESSRSETSFLRRFPVQKYVHVSVLNVILEHADPREMSNFPRLRLWLEKDVNSLPPRQEDDDSELQSSWGKMNAEILRGNWRLLSKCFFLFFSEVAGTTATAIASHLLRLCHEALDIGGHGILLPVMSALARDASAAAMDPLFESIVDTIWTLVAERKKNEEFQSLTKAFVELLFRRDLVSTDDELVQSILLRYSELMLTQSTVRSAALFMAEIQRTGYDEDRSQFYLRVLPRALLYGQVPRKDERLISDACSIVESKGLTPLKNDCSTSREIRARAIHIVLTLDPESESHRRFAEDLTDAVIAEEELITRRKARYFSDSNVHLVKQRLMQSVLILNRYVSKEYDGKLWKWVWGKLKLENNQPSVRCLQEWLMLVILRKRPELREEIWGLFDADAEKRVGSLCSLLSIVYLSARLVTDSSLESWLDKAIKVIFPYAMAQHFSIRLYAQVTLKKLMDLSRELGFDAVVDKYHLIDESLHESIERGNSGKNYSKLLADFYFSAFDPIEHYSAESILHDVPLLTSVARDELIDVSLLESYQMEFGGFDIPMANVNRSLDAFVARKSVASESHGACPEIGVVEVVVDVDDAAAAAASDARSYQKKVIPIKTLAPSGDELMQSLSYASRTNEDGLVVVASLIDRIPNLGGLSRTCEVFGASQLVIGSLKYAEDKQFQSLSVTAEKWITVTEVKPYHLREYLSKMKGDGYAVLAAEQATNSRSLESVQFPKKCLLLLGNEKEGIPPELLSLADVCVEIPQMGVVRSLNVHVTGALFAWEYAKQHGLGDRRRNSDP